MTENETIKVLSIMKAAYPTSFKGMTREDGLGMIRVWQMQFDAIPVELVFEAVNRLIGKNTFPPTVAEVKKELKEIRDDAEEQLWLHERSYGKIYQLPETELKRCRDVVYALASVDGHENHLPKSIAASTEPRDRYYLQGGDLNELC